MLFRSEKMNYYEQVMPHDSAWTVLNNLGNIEKGVQFIDQNNEVAQFNKLYNNYKVRCDDSLNQLVGIQKLLEKNNIELVSCKDPKPFLERLNNLLNGREQAEHTYLDEVEVAIAEKCQKTKQLNRTFEELNQKVNSLREYQQVLKETKPFIPANFSLYHDTNKDLENQDQGSIHSVRFNYLCGVINYVDKIK